MFNQMPSSTGVNEIMGMPHAHVKIRGQTWVSVLTLHLVGVSCHSPLAGLSDPWASRTCLCFTSCRRAGITDVHCCVQFSVNSGDLNVSLHVCMANALSVSRHPPLPCFCSSLPTSVTGKSHATAVINLASESSYLISAGPWMPPPNPY